MNCGINYLLINSRVVIDQFCAKLEKCEFWLDSVSFFGHVIFGNGVVVDLEKVKAIVEWTKPTRCSRFEVS